MSNTNNWTPAEVEMLRNGFLVHKSIKLLAKELNRSPTALNKALSRFKIRKKTRTLSNKPPVLKQKKEVKRHKKRLSIFDTHLQQTSFNQVIHYLRSQGYTINQKFVRLTPQKILSQCFINQRPVSHAHLLVIANRIRLDNQQPIFMVDNLSAAN